MSVINFVNVDSYSSVFTLFVKNVATAFEYLQVNFSSGETVVFTAPGNTYVF